MRVKLEMKKQRDTGSHDHCSCSNANHPTVHTTTTVTEYVWKSVYMYSYVHTCTHTRTHARTHTHTHTHIIHMYTPCIYTLLHIQSILLYIIHYITHCIFSRSSCKDDRSLDTLLEFINGPEEENQKMSSRAAKRQRRKQRKVLTHTIYKPCHDKHTYQAYCNMLQCQLLLSNMYIYMYVRPVPCGVFA